jgi:hypothetical protein
MLSSYIADETGLVTYHPVIPLYPNPCLPTVDDFGITILSCLIISSDGVEFIFNFKVKRSEENRTFGVDGGGKYVLPSIDYDLTTDCLKSIYDFLFPLFNKTGKEMQTKLAERFTLPTVS